jgi:hypothetical protein
LLIPTLVWGEPRPQRRFGLDDLGKLVGVAEPQIAPDGKSIAIAVSRPNYEKNDHDTIPVPSPTRTSGRFELEVIQLCLPRLVCSLYEKGRRLRGAGSEKSAKNLQKVGAQCAMSVEKADTGDVVSAAP